ncbi:alpha-galactosidase [Kineococcus xinjiangensis]|uniref:Alpha-galactosidase n=1 Tax=Kineococcus xinjiangensis TaxID=512762 RepID=A0A2S6IWG9_9ACTN|nr:alpha-galactosidase [Kineococcus xinjiangensis]PPK98688.1 alpha-galactosidase [Kineococcus xinjiangensis]
MTTAPARRTGDVPAGSVAPRSTDGELGAAGSVVHLSAAGVSLVVDCRGARLPRVLHWGADLGDLGADDLAALAAVSAPPVVPNGLDEPLPVTVLPEHAAGWAGLPGLLGSRDGRDWSPSFVTVSVTASRAEDATGGRLRVEAVDPDALLELDLLLELTAEGLLRMRATLTDAAVRGGGRTPYRLDGLVLALPLPGSATEVLDLTGRWGRERSPQRRPFGVDAHVRDSRRGRTGSDATLVLVAGEEGFGFRSGRVWGLHVGWSGNHRTYAERLPTGEAVIGGGELLLSGEVALGPGESYTTPWVYASCGEGLDEMSARFHAHLRARSHHPRRPRPVVMNTWEAVYFDHDLDRLTALADRGAEVGAELFVLDDGWFRGRRDDTAGLGDWFADERVWPHGLHPLVQHVRSRGMRMGLWVEPEMVNPDSELIRRHPDWILSTGSRTPPLVRSQQVLDLTRDEAFAHVLGRLDALVSEYALDYLKWDHNRDLVDAGSSRTGVAAVHRQTLAVYRLLDELRRRHPRLEVESCSSGGARVDLGILQRTDRVWASDCIDALERQSVQRWTGLLLPPEMIGSHVGAGRSHTTGRRHDLSFRAATALFGSFGIEWDLTAADEDERRELRQWVALYKSVRDWLHTGRVVRADPAGAATDVHGVLAADGSQALFAVVSTATCVTTTPGRLCLPGLDPDARYRVRVAGPAGVPPSTAIVQVPWLAEGASLPGRVLSRVGVQVPPQHPEHTLLLHVTREPRP